MLEHRRRPEHERGKAPEPGHAPTERTEDQQKALDAADELLDEIDRILEEQDLNTEEAADTFVRGYVQKGGE